MKPFGQWLNDFKPEVASEQDPYVAPRPEGCVIARCERCYDEVDPEHFGIRHDEVTKDMHFICDWCMGKCDPSMDGDDYTPPDEDGN